MKNIIKAISKTDDEFRVANYIILFGGRDLTGEYFTKNTIVESSYTKSGILHVDFEHGLDPDNVGMGAHDILGYVDWKTAKVDDTGIFVERVLNRRARYMNVLEDLIDAGVIGTSSEALPAKVQKTYKGEIVEWPLVRDSLTFTPAEPRMISTNVIASAKSLFQAFPNSKSLASFVTDSTLNIKAEIDAAKSLKEIETLLRDAGRFSRSDATALVSRIKSLCQSDSDAEKQRLDAIKKAFESIK